VNVEDKKDNDRAESLTNEIDEMKDKLKKLEDELRALKKQKFAHKAPSNNEGDFDYFNLINEMKE